jgi:uncharacterized protein YndB with AHSA1/START domain
VAHCQQRHRTLSRHGYTGRVTRRRSVITLQLETHLEVPFPIERVWSAWVDPDQVGVWFAAAANITPERGGAYELFWQPATPENESTIGCRITAISPPEQLAFTWRGPDVFASLMNEGADPLPPPTHVTVHLSATDVGTHVEVRHGGFGDDDRWDEVLAWHERAWQACLGNLAAFLADEPLPRPWS